MGCLSANRRRSLPSCKIWQRQRMQLDPGDKRRASQPIAHAQTYDDAGAEQGLFSLMIQRQRRERAGRAGLRRSLSPILPALTTGSRAPPQKQPGEEASPVMYLNA